MFFLADYANIVIINIFTAILFLGVYPTDTLIAALLLMADS